MITPISKYRKLRSKEKKQLAQSLPKTSYFSRVVVRTMESTDIRGTWECQGTWKGNVKVAIHGPLDGRGSWMIWGWGDVITRVLTSGEERQKGQYARNVT